MHHGRVPVSVWLMDGLTSNGCRISETEEYIIVIMIIIIVLYNRVQYVYTSRGAARNVRARDGWKGVWGDKWELNRQTARARDSPRAMGRGSPGPGSRRVEDVTTLCRHRRRRRRQLNV